MSTLNITAVVAALNEQEFIGKCLRSIYPFATRIYVVSNYDTDYYGNELRADNTIDLVTGFDDPDRKVVLLVNRRILDETIQRNWAMSSDRSLYQVSHRRFLPHAHTLDEIRDRSPKTDFFWIVDADEIYDTETIPGAIDFLHRTRWDAVLVRGYNYFKKWNYRISLASDQFWQIGFLRPGRYLHSRRCLYFPRPLGWLGHINPGLSRRLIDYYSRQTRLPECVAHFHHGSYVGDDDRIKKKLLVSSHAKDLRKHGVDEWFQNVWKCWTPETRNFYFPSQPEAWASADYVPTSKLPSIIKDSDWPDGWIDKQRATESS